MPTADRFAADRLAADRLVVAQRAPDPDAAVPPDAAALAAALRDAFRHMGEPPLKAAVATAPKIAVLIPCHNEEATIGDVIAAFAAALPQARIVVFDNSSTDDTSARARAAGAEVHFEPRLGKGNVVRRMFAEIDADVYLMADGDGTYDASAAPILIDLIVEERIDMAIGARAACVESHRRGHAAGNVAFNRLYKYLFGPGYGDVFSGYRAFSRRFVKSFPALSSGFEIETELSVHASQLKLPVREVMLPYGKRPEGSRSKLRTFRDGWRILRAFAFLLKETRPAAFFTSIAAALFLVATGLALPLAKTWLDSGLVPRLPTAVLCTGLTVLSGLMLTCGLVLDSLARSRVEQKRILYLAIAAFKG